jgi:prepilin-type N-terminal cleavage/methylation domain-containing protein
MKTSRRSQETAPARRYGSTLIELVVVLAILGVIAGVAGLSFGEAPKRSTTDKASARVAAARREAIRAGRAVTAVVIRDGHVMMATARADGSVVADSALSVDRFSGRPLQ